MRTILVLLLSVGLTSCASLGDFAVGLTGTTAGADWAVSVKVPVGKSAKEPSKVSK